MNGSFLSQADRGCFGRRLCSSQTFRVSRLTLLTRDVNGNDLYGVGGGQKSTMSPSPYRRYSHAEIFFCTPDISAIKDNQRNQKTESFQRSSAAARVRKLDLFSPPPGAVKSLEAFGPGPAAPQRASFREFRETFFSQPGVRCVSEQASR